MSLLDDIDALPPLPYVAHEILLAINSDDSNLADVAKALEKEPGLTARIVSMANSAFFAHQRTVYSVEDALVRLGLNRVRVLAASILLAQQFDTRHCPAFRPARYWHDAVATAFAFARLGQHLEPAVPQDQAYLAGLLHNIGLLLLVHVFPREMSAALSHSDADPDMSLATLCRQHVGADYHQAGRLLLTEWNLPAEVVAVAAHIGEYRPTGKHARMVLAARFCQRWAIEGFHGLPAVERPEGVPESSLQRIGAQCQREEEQMAAFAELLAAM